MPETLETVDLQNTPCPAVSIIIPLYNAANQIAECLDSLLAQTFQDFEVIVVDDCSTDNSIEIVKSYEEKFDGRLTLTKTEKNSGGGGYVPRNLGLSLANGEYVFFLDADDFILLTALETLYNAAKEYDADVVYTGYFYNLVSSNSIYLRQDGESKKLLREGLEDKIDLRIDDQKGNLSKLLLEEREGHFRNPWSRFVKRELLIENKIIFPAQMTTGGDFIWVISLYCHAKKFLRIPTPIYFYRNYNAESVTQTKRIPSEQLAHWISAFVDFAKNLSELENQNAILSENPAYCLQTLKSHFDWCLSRTNDARKELSNQDIYEILYREFAKDSSGASASLLPFFFSFIDTEIKVGDERLQTINQLEKNVADLKKSFAHPAISVIVPMYNVEEYIAECLDSILLQTFQDYEVIVVDDCSTDNSVKIVESYIPKFDGRLKLFHMEKNTGSGALPRNRGLSISNGEYIYLTDADDFILLDTLEILYTSAKKYDADVVYTGSYYKMKATNDVYVYRDGEGHKLLRDGLEDKPNLYVDDQVGNLNRLLLQEKEGNFRGPTTKFIKRKLLIDNKIYFPKIPIGEDFIWVINVYCHAKRFLRISTPFYFYRLNTASVTKTKRTPSEQLNHWISAFVDFTKSLRELESENEVLSKNPAYCLSALQGHFEWCFYFINEARKELSNQEIYESLHREFAKDSSGSIVPFFFSFIDSEKRIGSERLQTIQNLQKIISQPKNLSDFLSVSVIIPMYNAEKYITECLDSLLEQTFQDFEVIVVDDCSTDNSVEIVKSYEEKFNGRLLLTKMEKNSGSGGLPRNKGMTLSRGEYIQFLDADDMLTNTALEEMYTLAKEYNADVVYCEKHYKKDDFGINICVFQPEPLVNKPVLETNDLNERVESILNLRFVESTCFKFVQRKLLLDNEIFFPHICPSEDDIWTYGLIFHAKRLLRVPNAIYIRRISRNSIMRKERNAKAEVNFWLNPALLGSKALDELMSRIEFFQKNPQRRYAMINKFINGKLNLSFRNATPLFPSDIYSVIKEKFGEELGKYDVLISALCATLYSVKVPLPLNNENSTSYLDAAILRRFANYITAKLFVQMHKKQEPENLQIVSVSDSRAKISKPAAWQKFGNCYMIDSYSGQLEIVAKANDDGQVRVLLAGPWALNPKDKTKKLPYWIDYTKLIVNDKLIFNKVTPAWHDKNYIHGIDVKAGDEITIKVEWLPHRSDT